MLWDEYGDAAFENIVLRRIFGARIVEGGRG
jgi:hypothetical protein